jgi:hypothetical protein
MVSPSFSGDVVGARGERRLTSFFIELSISWSEKRSKIGFIVGSSWNGAQNGHQ